MNGDVVVVIATYNEAESISELLDKLEAYDVIVVDDSSPDRTATIAEQHGAKVLLRPKKMGIASAYLDGFKEALKGDYNYIVQMDAGLNHNPDNIKKMLDIIRACGGVLVIGSRFLDHTRWLSYRTVISKIATLLVNQLWKGKYITDVTSGFRVWRADSLERLLKNRYWLPVKSQGFAFNFEMLFNCKKLCGQGIEEIEIDYKLSNTSFNFKMLLEAICIYFRLVKFVWRIR